MAIHLNELVDSALACATSEEEFALYRAALEWQLATPIAIRSGEDILSRDRWRDRVQPFHHQVRNLITFCRLAPAVLLADEVGLGKTISAGLILSELMVRKRVNRTLVICPKILCDQWVGELAGKFRIKGIVATGADFLAACNTSEAVVITTYETAGRYLNSTGFSEDTFQMLILDEAHRLRNFHGTSNPPTFAVAIQKTLESRIFNYVLMLTATPIQNRFSDIYSLIDLLTTAKGHRNPFGNYFDFKSTFLEHGSAGRKLRASLGNHFRSILNDYVARTRRVDADLPFPTRLVKTIRVPLTKHELGLEKIVSKIMGKVISLVQSSLGEALMSSPSALAAQLERMADKSSVFKPYALQVRAIADNPSPPAKLNRLFKLCDELRAARSDWRLVVFTRSRETQKMIQIGLTARSINVGLISGGRAKENLKDIADFLVYPPKNNVLVSTDAGAEGVNLQEANWLVNYDLPWNPMILEQRIGRIQRLGSPHKEVLIQNFVAAGTVEEDVVDRLMQRLIAVTETVGDLESILEATRSGDDSGEAFAKQVRELVVRSLQGYDQSKAAEQLASSIEKAKQEYEINCGQMNRDIGSLDGSGAKAPPLPAFNNPKPSISSEEFVLRSLIFNKNKINEIRKNIFQVIKKNGLAEYIALSPQAAEGQDINYPLTLIFPGQRAFDRIVNSWANQRCHRVFDFRKLNDDFAKLVGINWCSNYPGIEFVQCKIRNNLSHIHGKVALQIVGKNRIDQHEKIVEYPISPEGHKVLFLEIPEAPILNDIVSLREISSHAVARVEGLAIQDKEMNEFNLYYNFRRISELSRAGSNPHLQQRVAEDFNTTFSAKVVGFRGFCYDRVNLDIIFQVQGFEYSSTIQAIPIFNQIIEKPSDETCLITKITMPKGVLSRCERSDELIPKHLLFKSEYSGRQAAIRFKTICEFTNKEVLDDEIEICAITGLRVLKTELVTCSVSNARILKAESGVSAVSNVLVRRDLLIASERPPHRLGLANELVKCEISNRTLVKDEVELSAVSSRPGDIDLLVRSERPPYRYGLPDEVVKCEHTNATLLLDEVVVCCISSKRVNSTLLQQSQISRRSALPDFFLKCAVTAQNVIRDELEKCAITEKLALPDQLEICAITGLRVLKTELVTCSVSNARILKAESGVSAVSNALVRRDLLIASERPPHRLGLASELVKCSFSDKSLLIDEVARSSVSGRLSDSLLLELIKEKTVHSSEVIVCQKTGKRMLPSDVSKCSISNLLVDSNLLIKSHFSNRLLLPEYSATCSVNGFKVCPDELEKCSISGFLAIRDEFGICQSTGIKVLKKYLVRCVDTEKTVIHSQIGYSDYRSRPVLKSLLKKSQKSPGRLGTWDELAKCQKTGKLLLLDELSRCDLTNRLVDSSLIVTCGETHKKVLNTETTICAWQNIPIIDRYVGICELTKLTIAKRFLDQNDMLIPLAKMLDGRNIYAPFDATYILPMITKIDGNYFKGASQIRAIRSPGKQMRYAVYLTLEKKGWFRNQIKHVGFILDADFNGSILGCLVQGIRNNNGEWELQDRYTFTK
jgi:superfamily II DNA or RNA helicase